MGTMDDMIITASDGVNDDGQHGHPVRSGEKVAFGVTRDGEHCERIVPWEINGGR